MSKNKHLNDKFDYDIECTTDTDYKLMLTFYAQNKLMKMAFNGAIRHKKLKDRVKGKAKFENITSFEVPQQYLNLLRSGINKPVIIVKNIFKADGVELLTDRLTRAVYTKLEAGGWRIDMTLEGLYLQRG